MESWGAYAPKNYDNLKNNILKIDLKRKEDSKNKENLWIKDTKFLCLKIYRFGHKCFAFQFKSFYRSNFYKMKPYLRIPSLPDQLHQNASPEREANANFYRNVSFYWQIKRSRIAKTWYIFTGYLSPLFTWYFSPIFYSFIYRVSLKTVAIFIFWISRLPRGLDIPCWTFFNSPFCVDFKNIQFSIIWWHLNQDISKILQGGHFKN